MFNMIQCDTFDMLTWHDLADLNCLTVPTSSSAFQGKCAIFFSEKKEWRIVELSDTEMEKVDLEKQCLGLICIYIYMYIYMIYWIIYIYMIYWIIYIYDILDDIYIYIYSFLVPIWGAFNSRRMEFHGCSELGGTHELAAKVYGIQEPICAAMKRHSFTVQRWMTLQQT